MLANPQHDDEETYAAMAEEILRLEEKVKQLNGSLEQAEFEKDNLLDRIDNLEEERQDQDERIEKIFEAMETKKKEHEDLNSRLVTNQQSHVIKVREVHREHHEMKKADSLSHISRGVARSIFYRHRQLRAVLKHLHLYALVVREKEAKLDAIRELRSSLEAAEQKHDTDMDARVAKHKDKVEFLSQLPMQGLRNH